MLSFTQKGNDQEINPSAQSQEAVQKKDNVGSKQGQKPAIQAKQQTIQAKQLPIQAKHKPIQAKQSPIQRNSSKGVVQRNSPQGDDLKQRMSAQYKVDLSEYKEHPNSSFPGTVGADATIQGKNIHYGPGKFTEENRKHEFGHAIDNAKNGTPKGDKVINGKNIDTTREAAADKIMNTPVQAKVGEGEQTIQQKAAHSGDGNQPLQTLSRIGDMPKVFEALNKKNPKANLTVDKDLEKYWGLLVKHQHTHNIANMEAISVDDAVNILTPTAMQEGRSLAVRSKRVDQSIKRSQSLNRRDESNNIQNGGIEQGDISLLNTEQRGRVNTLVRNQMIDESIDSMLQRADASLKEFSDKMEAASKKIQTKLAGDYQVAGLKGRDRIKQKTDLKYNYDPNRVIDVVRGTFTFKTAQDLADGAKILIGDFKIAQQKNDIGRQSDTGYRDMKLNVRLSTGFMGEIQLQLKALNDAKTAGGGHALYKLIRDASEGRDTVFDNDEKGHEKAEDMKTKLDQVKATLDQKAQSDDAITQEQANEYKTFLDRKKGEIGKGATVKVSADELETLKAISRQVYENANKQVDSDLKNQGVAREFFTTLNQHIDDQKARKAEKSVKINAPKNVKKGSGYKRWFGNGDRVGYGNRRFRVTDVSGHGNNCLIHAIAEALGVHYSEAGAQILRRGIGINHNNFLENNNDIVNNITTNLGHRVRINWWTQDGNGNITPAGHATYGNGAAHAPINIVNVSDNHFQTLNEIQLANNNAN
ncbi:hypothetical protein BKI52_15420 [marine bacterium AO1-C]|nr:hypothetical protein BKI52_15420 [marine bacterium AO1-C]